MMLLSSLLRLRPHAAKKAISATAPRGLHGALAMGA
jgi:hypothetical protein